ncbi:MAG: hypothetical protein AAB436_01155 [Patescibacteria group bacterium]
MIDVIIGKIVPHDCLGCGIEGSLLCFGCSAALPSFPSRCYRCHKPSVDRLTCCGCLSSGLARVAVATTYASTAKNLIWKLKLSGVQAAATTMAKSMAPLIAGLDTIIVPVPTATSRMRQRGYDQAKLLARELSRLTRLPYLDCLGRSGQMHQHGLSRAERLSQLRAAYRVKRPAMVDGANILLVDTL